MTNVKCEVATRETCSKLFSCAKVATFYYPFVNYLLQRVSFGHCHCSQGPLKSWKATSVNLLRYWAQFIAKGVSVLGFFLWHTV